MCAEDLAGEMENVYQQLKAGLRPAWGFAQAFCKWLLIGSVIGVIGGCLGAGFDKCVEWAGEARARWPYIICLLPLGGAAIVGLYRLARVPSSTGTNEVFEQARTGRRVPFLLAPLIFVSTTLTHLLGGSAGREGAALQLGGSFAGKLAQALRLDEEDRQTATLCGMSAVFSAMFGTPLCATLFPLEVVSVGAIGYGSLMPCMLASFGGYITAGFWGSVPVRFAVSGAQTMTLAHIGGAAGIAVACALISILFCVAMHKTGHLFAKIKNEYLRAAVGGAAILGLTFLSGSRLYNSTGMTVISAAIAGGAVPPEAFLVKILFTAVTLGSGFKGGEIVPSFFVGATLGALIGPWLGLTPGFGAALGLTGLFCGVTNAPISSLLLALELFGMNDVSLFAIVCAVSYMLSGYYSLYSSQKIIFSKLKAHTVNYSAH